MSDLSEAQKKRSVQLIGKYLEQGLKMNQAVSNARAELSGQKPRHQPPDPEERALKAASRREAMKEAMQKFREILQEQPALSYEQAAQLANELVPQQVSEQTATSR